MIATARLCLASIVLCAALPVGAQTGTAPAKPRALNIEAVTNAKFTGDFDQMLERRHIRFAAPYSRTLFYSDKGRERGLTAELAREFEQYVNRKYAKQLGKRPFTVILIPSTRTELIEDVANGLADIGAGNLSVTEARLQKVDMVAPEDLKPMSEVLLTGPKSPAVATIDDLAGKTIHLRPSSSYYESVTRLSERFRKEGKPPVTIIKLPDALEDEDIMEMLNAGLLQFAVVDDWKAKIWAQILPNVKVREDIVLAGGTRPGWAIRKGSPKLRAELEEFYANYVKKQGTHAYRVTQLQKRVKQIGNNTADAERKRFNDTLALFQKYGPKYGFDPVMLAAQGYQESQLRQDARSHVGAIGIMQIMPATGKDLKVGDITVAEANVHGGAKYMDQLMTLYFKDANFSPTNRSLFAFASYNAGPGRIAQMRKEAEKRGLDPNLWFNNVEIVTAEKVGIETTTYVRNIYKYYVSYTLLLESQDDVKKAREAVTAPAK